MKNNNNRGNIHQKSKIEYNGQCVFPYAREYRASTQNRKIFNFQIFNNFHLYRERSFSFCFFLVSAYIFLKMFRYFSLLLSNMHKHIAHTRLLQFLSCLQRGESTEKNIHKEKDRTQNCVCIHIYVIFFVFRFSFDGWLPLFIIYIWLLLSFYSCTLYFRWHLLLLVVVWLVCSLKATIRIGAHVKIVPLFFLFAEVVVLLKNGLLCTSIINCQLQIKCGSALVAYSSAAHGLKVFAQLFVCAHEFKMQLQQQ